MNGYIGLAAFYDVLMDFDYDRLTEYYREIFEKFDASPKTVLDLCCGTGQVTRRLAEAGYDLVGVDSSPEMLSCAQNACDAQSTLLLCQDICELDLNDTVDAVTCALDGVNHLLSTKALQSAFERAALFCNDNGIFVFDVHSKHKFFDVLGNHCFVFDEKEVYCAWQTQLFGKCLQHTLDFFIPQKDKSGAKTYTRSFDDFNEYYYSREQLERALDRAGFELLDVYGDMTFDAADEEAHERLFYVARRKERSAQ